MPHYGFLRYIMSFVAGDKSPYFEQVIGDQNKTLDAPNPSSMLINTSNAGNVVFVCFLVYCCFLTCL